MEQTNLHDFLGVLQRSNVHSYGDRRGTLMAFIETQEICKIPGASALVNLSGHYLMHGKTRQEVSAGGVDTDFN